MEKLIENATIIFKNGKKEFYNAITVEENGIYTGNIKFINHSYIPKNRIEKIIIFDHEGNSKFIEIKNKGRK